MGIKRLRQHCPAHHINADPITVQRNLKPPFRAEFRVGAPADIGQQAGSTPDPPPFGAFSVESRSNPTVNQVAMPRKTTLLFTFYSCGRQERIKRPDLFGKVIEKRSEEHTSELQSLMRNSYAVFCLKQKTNKILRGHHNIDTRN